MVRHNSYGVRTYGKAKFSYSICFSGSILILKKYIKEHNQKYNLKEIKQILKKFEIHFRFFGVK